MKYIFAYYIVYKLSLKCVGCSMVWLQNKIKNLFVHKGKTNKNKQQCFIMNIDMNLLSISVFYCDTLESTCIDLCVKFTWLYCDAKNNKIT